MTIILAKIKLDRATMNVLWLHTILIQTLKFWMIINIQFFFSFSSSTLFLTFCAITSALTRSVWLCNFSITSGHGNNLSLTSEVIKNTLFIICSSHKRRIVKDNVGQQKDEENKLTIPQSAMCTWSCTCSWLVHRWASRTGLLTWRKTQAQTGKRVSLMLTDFDTL